MRKSLIVVFAVSFLFSLSACDKELENGVKVIESSHFKKVISDDFEKQNPAWEAYVGSWNFKNGELEQSSVKDSYPVILRKDKQYADLDISVDFKPVSGNIDASGGLIFRAVDESNFYIVRANALEGNFRLYTFVDGYRHQIASASVEKPALNQYHTIRIIAQGKHIQAFLNGQLQIDHTDETFKKGYTGLWTKEDSVTLFDNYKIKFN